MKRNANFRNAEKAGIRLCKAKRYRYRNSDMGL